MIAGMVLFSSLAYAYEVTVANYTPYKVHVNLYFCIIERGKRPIL